MESFQIITIWPTISIYVTIYLVTIYITQIHKQRPAHVMNQFHSNHNPLKWYKTIYMNVMLM